MKSENLSDILASCPDKITLTFCGEQITIPGGRYLYSNIRKKYMRLAKEAGDNFVGRITPLDKWSDYDSINSIFAVCAAPIVDEISRDAISIGLYTLDRLTIMQMCENQGYFVHLYNKTEELKKQYESILTQLGLSAVINEIKKENRTQFSVATISDRFTDAVKSEIKVSALNAATGLAYDFLNNIRNNASKKKALEQMNSAFKLSKLDYISAARFAYTCFFDFVVFMLKDNYPDIEIPESDLRSASSIFNNMSELALPRKQEYDMARQIVALAPFVVDYYKDFYKRFPEYNVEVFNAAKTFGVDISNVIYKETASIFEKKLNGEFKSVSECIDQLTNLVTQIPLSVNCIQKLFTIIESHYCDLITQNIHNRLSSENLTFEDIGSCKLDMEEKAKKYDLIPLYEFLSIVRYSSTGIYVRPRKDFYKELYAQIDKAHIGIIIKNAKKIMVDSNDDLIKAEKYINETMDKFGFDTTQKGQARNEIKTYFVERAAEKIRSILNETPESVVNAEDYLQDLNSKYSLPDSGLAINVIIKEHRMMLTQKLIDQNIGETIESAKECSSVFDRFASTVRLPEDEYESFRDIIENALNERDSAYRTVAGIEVETREEADEIRSIIEANPDISDKDYVFESRDDILAASNKLNKLFAPYDSRITEYFSALLNSKLNQFDIDRIREEITNRPKMISHADYENFIKRIEASPIDESEKINALKKYKNEMKQFECNCGSAQIYNKFKVHKNIFWWLNGENGFLIIFHAIVVFLICGLANLCWKEMMPLFTLIVKIGIIIFAIYSLIDSISSDVKCWRSVTQNGKYKLEDISKTMEFRSRDLEEKYPAIKDTPPTENKTNSK